MRRKIKRLTAALLVALILIIPIPSNAATYASLSQNPEFHYGVDVSTWNGSINWAHLRSIGVDFAFIRIGYYYPGKGYIDNRFVENIKGCVENGIDFGVYVYSYVYKYTDCVKCADWVHKTLKSMGNYTKDRDTIQVAYDIEDEAQTKPVSKRIISRHYLYNGVQKFCNRIKKYNYAPVVYSSEYFFSTYLNLDGFRKKGVKIWLAQWPYYPNTWIKKVMDDGTSPDVWQFSSDYTISGVRYDTNVCYGDFYDYSNEDSKLTIKGLKDYYSCEKAPAAPSFKVYDGKTLLKKNTDYKVYYFDNDRPGKARAKIVRFKNGKYRESKTFFFTISPYGVKKLTALPSHDSIKLTWEKMSGADYYEIFEYDSVSKEYDRIDQAKTNSYTDFFLEEGTKYKLAVRAVKKVNSKKICGDMKKISAYTNYSPVNGITVDNSTKGSIKLTWKPKSANCEGYEIRYTADKTFKKYSSRITTEPLKTKFTLNKRPKGNTYYFRVLSYNTVNGKKVYSTKSKTVSSTII